MRVKSTVIVLAIVASSCSTGDSAVPGIAGSPDLETVDSTASSPVDDTTPPPTNAPDTTFAPNARETTLPPTTTGVPADACGSLATNGYDTRKQTLARLTDPELAMTEETCPDALEQLRGAMTIEQRMGAFNALPAPLSATDLVCDGANFSLTITNNVDHPIGIHASMRLVAEGVDGPLGSTLQPLVIWSLEPGASDQLTDKYELNRPTEAPLTCEVDITAFDATPGDADASVGETQVPELAVDDPAQWLPFLVAQGAAIIGTGNPDLAAVIEDIRSTGFPRVVSLTEVAIDETPTTGTISVCTASIQRPDDRHISIVYFDERAETSELQHGLFRRGNDDQWRWLSSSIYFDSREYWNCGTPSINL